MKTSTSESNTSVSPKPEKKYNYFYKITNKINNHFYYGVHCTDNLDDGYFGSGYALNLAIQKYGKGNFLKEDLKFFSTAEEVFDYESKIVTKELIKDPNCYNLVPGGMGNHPLGRVVVKDKDGNYLTVDKDDPRYQSRELVPVSTGRIHVFKLLEDGIYINKFVLKEELDAYTNSGWAIGTLNRGRVWVRLEDESGNIIHRKMINGDELKNYLNLGWSEGIGHVENRSTIEGLIYIHRKLENDRFEKTYITPDKVEDYINSGWILGCEQKGKKRVHRTNSDGKEEIRTVSEDEYDSYLADGWKPGYTDDHSRFATQTGRKKIFKWLDDGSLKLLSVKKEEFEDYINNGWSSGNIQPNKLGLILVSKRVKGDKKVEQIYIPESLVNKYIDKGWRLGKIK